MGALDLVTEAGEGKVEKVSREPDVNAWQGVLETKTRAWREADS